MERGLGVLVVVLVHVLALLPVYVSAAAEPHVVRERSPEHRTIHDTNDKRRHSSRFVGADVQERISLVKTTLGDTQRAEWMATEEAAEQPAVRRRRQASSSSTTSQAILDLRSILQPLSIASVAQCTDLFTNILGACNSYVHELLDEQFTKPLVAVLDQYHSMGESCTVSCTGFDCNALSTAIMGILVVVNKSNISDLLDIQVKAICTESTGTQSTSALNPIVTLLGEQLVGLNTAVDIPTILKNSSCLPILAQYSSQLTLLSVNLPVVQNIPRVLNALQTYSETLQLIQFEIPRRVYASYNFLANGGLSRQANATYVNASIAFILCSSIFPDETFRPCPWLCRNITELFVLAERFGGSSSNISARGTTITALLRELGDSCLSDTADWSLCSDVACPTSDVCVPIPNNTRRADMTTAQLATHVARHQASGVCFRPVCPFPLRVTNNSRHWDTTVQAVLRSGYDAARSLLEETGLSFNGSVLPCGLKCASFTFDAEDEKTGKIVVGVFGWLLFLVNLFALISFYLNRVRLNKYPTKILLYLNLTSFISNLAMLVQFFTNKTSYVCFDDDTLRMNEPSSSSEHGSRLCTFIFILLFYFLLVSLFWWLALAHAWYITFERLDTKGLLPEDNNKYLYFYHAVAWTVPAVLTGVMLGKHYIDGFPLVGVCFTNNVDSLFALLSVPIVVVGLLGLPFLLKGSSKLLLHKKHMHSMSRVRRPSSRAVRSQSGLRNFLVKLMIIMIMSFINLLVQFAVGLFMRVNWKRWQKEIEDHLMCELTRCSLDDYCPVLPEPSVFPFLLIPVTITLEGLVLCSWAFTHDTWQTWKDKTRKPSEFFSRASSLGIVRQFTGTEKPNIANIAAARKAAKHIHMKASRRHQADQSSSDATATTTSTMMTDSSYVDASAWDSTNTDVNDMSVHMSTERHLESNLVKERSIDSGTAGTNGKLANGEERQKSRVKINPDASYCPAPSGNQSKVELDHMQSSPSSKRRAFQSAGVASGGGSYMSSSPLPDSPALGSRVEGAVSASTSYIALSSSPRTMRHAYDNTEPESDTMSVTTDIGSQSPTPRPSMLSSTMPQPAPPLFAPHGGGDGPRSDSRSSMQNAMAGHELLTNYQLDASSAPFHSTEV